MHIRSLKHTNPSNNLFVFTYILGYRGFNDVAKRLAPWDVPDALPGSGKAGKLFVSFVIYSSWCLFRLLASRFYLNLQDLVTHTLIFYCNLFYCIRYALHRRTPLTHGRGMERDGVGEKSV